MTKTTTKCKSCGEDIIFLTTTNGRPIPVNAETVRLKDHVFCSGVGHVAHFSTCPDAAKHRKPKVTEVAL